MQPKSEYVDKSQVALCPNLEKLDLSGCTIGDSELWMIAGGSAGVYERYCHMSSE